MDLGEIKLGEIVHCVEKRNKTTYEAQLIGKFISLETGYCIAQVMNTATFQMKDVEFNHVLKDKQTAEDHLRDITSDIDAADHVVKETNQRLDEIRARVIGQPPFKKLSDICKASRTAAQPVPMAGAPSV